MAIWLCRAGKMGEFETRFLEEQRIYCTFEHLSFDMASINERTIFRDKLNEIYGSTKKESVIVIWYGQIWAFAKSMAIKDLVLMPSMVRQTVHIGEITSDYIHDTVGGSLCPHYRRVLWKGEVPLSIFDQDLIYTLRSSFQVCGVYRNNAEQRIKELVSKMNSKISVSAEDNLKEIDYDLEEGALQEISEQIIRKTKGHDMARLVAAILTAKGFTTYISPPGPDKGVDILASQGSLGFDSPRICVQVKSGKDPVDRPTLDQLIGTMANHKADYGLLVSWGGFRKSVIDETANHFFKVRLWTHKEILKEFLAHYESLPEEIRELIPLKKIWIIDKKDE